MKLLRLRKGIALTLIVSVSTLLLLVVNIRHGSLSSLKEKRMEHDDGGINYEPGEMLRQLHDPMARTGGNKTIFQQKDDEKINLVAAAAPVVLSLPSSGMSTDLLPLKILPVDDTYRTTELLEDLLKTPENPPVHEITRIADDIPYMTDPLYQPPKCPKTISSKGRYSSWFKTRFKADIKMFLDKDDIYNFDNYDKLNRYHMPFGVKGLERIVLGKIMHNVNFTNPPINRPTNKCIRCAVVGSGGVLNGSKAGGEIDSHDFVFRLNHARHDERYVKDVGRKISFYGFYPESQGVRYVDNPNAAFIYTSFKPTDIYYAERMLQGITNDNLYFLPNGKNVTFGKPPALDASRLKITHPDFFRYIYKEFLDLKGSRPTTGATTVFTALHICDEVTIYGFGYDPRFSIHYYDTEYIKHTNKSTGCHDIHNERALWDKLHSEGVLNFFKRDL